MSDVIGEIAASATTAKRGPSLAWRTMWKALGHAPTRNRHTVEGIWVPVADGTRLAADLYRPTGVASPATMMIRTPYGRGELGAPPPTSSQHAA
jgi:predicted acyl esterase